MINLNLPAKTDSTVRDLFESAVIQEQIAKALPSALTVERLTRIMLTVFRTNKKLLDCSQHSLLACFFGCAQLGLTPEPWLGQAYLVPFWSSKLKCNEATLIPGYRGLITLARRSGELRTVKAAAVYEREPFEWERLYPERSRHGYVDGDPGELKGAWTLWTFKDDNVTGDFMTIHEIDKIMQRTKSRNRQGEIVGPWVTDKAEMAKKTVIRRHFKLAPVSVDEQRLGMAVAAEDIAIGQGPEGQRNLFLPDLRVPEPKYTADDFDQSCANIMQHELFDEFFTNAMNVVGSVQGGQMDEDAVKIQIMVDGVGDFQDAFERSVNAASAKQAKPADKKKATPKKKAPAKRADGKKKSKPVDKPEADRESDRESDREVLTQSDCWQEMSMLKDREQIIWDEESGGQVPSTIPACIDLVDRISARLEVSGDIPG
jgi:phage RecT family recombinase